MEALRASGTHPTSPKAGGSHFLPQVIGGSPSLPGSLPSRQPATISQNPLITFAGTSQETKLQPRENVPTIDSGMVTQQWGVQKKYKLAASSKATTVPTNTTHISKADVPDPLFQHIFRALEKPIANAHQRTNLQPHQQQQGISSNIEADMQVVVHLCQQFHMRLDRLENYLTVKDTQIQRLQGVAVTTKHLFQKMTSDWRDLVLKIQNALKDNEHHFFGLENQLLGMKDRLQATATMAAATNNTNPSDTATKFDVDLKHMDSHDSGFKAQIRALDSVVQDCQAVSAEVADNNIQELSVTAKVQSLQIQQLQAENQLLKDQVKGLQENQIDLMLKSTEEKQARENLECVVASLQETMNTITSASR